MENLTFEKMPAAIEKISSDISELKALMIEIITSLGNHDEVEQDEFLNIKQAAAFLGLTQPTMYSKVSRREIPVMKRGKRLYFSKMELTDYLKKGKKF